MLTKLIAAALAAAAATLAGAATASAQAILAVDPVEPCYREQSTVHLSGSGYGPSAPVVFTRSGRRIGDPIAADASGAVDAQLILPGLVSGQQRLTYMATDSTNTSLTAEVGMLVSATNVELRPQGGPPHRLLTVQARGFFRDEEGRGSGTLWAHVVRLGKSSAPVRHLRIGTLRDACREVTAKRRLFSRDAAPGRYRVQFDSFRRYRRSRIVKTRFSIKVVRTAGTARAAGVSRAS